MRIINAPNPFNILQGANLGPVVPKLKALFLSSPTVAEGVAPATVIGEPQNLTAGSTWVLTDTAGNRYARSGNDIVVGATAIDFEDVGIIDLGGGSFGFRIQITETNGAFANSPRVSTIDMPVTDVAESEIIPVPVLTLLSAPGAALELQVDVAAPPENIAGNYDWYVEVAGDAGFTIGPGAEPSVRISQRQVLLSDFVDDDADGNPEVEPFTATSNLPAGQLWIRFSFRADDGSIGVASNVITHTITNAVVSLSTTTGTDKSQWIDTDDEVPEVLGKGIANVGAFYWARTTSAPIGTKIHLECTAVTSSATGLTSFGIVPAAASLGPSGTNTYGQTADGITFSFRIGFNVGRLYRNLSNQGFTLADATQAGDVFIMEIDLVSWAVSVWRKRGATLALVTTQTVTSGQPTDPTAAIAAQRVDDTGRLNFGGTAFAQTPSTGYAGYDGQQAQ